MSMITTTGKYFDIGDHVKLVFPKDYNGTEYYITGELTRMTKKFCRITITYSSRKDHFENIDKWKG